MPCDHQTPEIFLETLIRNRTTTRSFSEVTPDKVEIEKIVAAGFYAPFAIIGSKDNPGIRIDKNLLFVVGNIENAVLGVKDIVGT